MIYLTRRDQAVILCLAAVALVGLAALGWLRYSRQVQLTVTHDARWAQQTAAWDAQLAAAQRVDVNHAGLEELEQLPGVGPTLAERIIAARPFRRVDDLDEVDGIGPALIERLRPYAVAE